MTEEKLLTPEGLQKLKDELEERKNVRRHEIKNRIEEAIKLGDFSENAEYHEAKDDQGMNEARIREIENIIKNAKVVESTTGKKDQIGIGCVVKAKFDGQEKEFTIDPEDAYGPRNEEYIREVPRTDLPENINPEVGMVLRTQTQTGQSVPVVIVEVNKETIKIDFNHPLAGKKLIFKIKIIDIK